MIPDGNEDTSKEKKSPYTTSMQDFRKKPYLLANNFWNIVNVEPPTIIRYSQLTIICKSNISYRDISLPLDTEAAQDMGNALKYLNWVWVASTGAYMEDILAGQGFCTYLFVKCGRIACVVSSTMVSLAYQASVEEAGEASQRLLPVLVNPGQCLSVLLLHHNKA